MQLLSHLPFNICIHQFFTHYRAVNLGQGYQVLRTISISLKFIQATETYLWNVNIISLLQIRPLIPYKSTNQAPFRQKIWDYILSAIMRLHQASASAVYLGSLHLKGNLIFLFCQNLLLYALRTMFALSLFALSIPNLPTYPKNRTFPED